FSRGHKDSSSADEVLVDFFIGVCSQKSHKPSMLSLAGVYRLGQGAIASLIGGSLGLARRMGNAIMGFTNSSQAPKAIAPEVSTSTASVKMAEEKFQYHLIMKLIKSEFAEMRDDGVYLIFPN